MRITNQETTMNVITGTMMVVQIVRKTLKDLKYKCMALMKKARPAQYMLKIIALSSLFGLVIIGMNELKTVSSMK